MSRDIAMDVLAEVDDGVGLARERLDGALAAAGPGLDPRDRDLAREIVYGVLRRRSSLDHLLRERSKRRLQALTAPVRAALRAAAYQIVLLDRVPPSAAVDHAVGRVRRAADPRAAGYANAVLRDLARSVAGRGPGDGDDDPLRTLPLGDHRCVRFRRRWIREGEDPDVAGGLRWSLPPWLHRRWRERMDGPTLRTCLRAGVARPGTWIRPLPGRGGDTAEALRERGIPFEEEDGAFLLRGAGAVEALPGHDEGHWIVQDPAAHRAVELLAAAPGERILELGCGRGGKTLLLAAAGARVTAVDRDRARLDALEEALRRTGLADRVTVVEADGTDLSALPGDPFDAALVDAPCSNTGVLARRVEARWRLRAADLEPLAGLGRRLLESALARLRPGGRAVHSVCSLEPEEGPDVVRRALRRFPGLRTGTEELLLPVPGRRDGGWVARVERLSESAGKRDAPARAD